MEEKLINDKANGVVLNERPWFPQKAVVTAGMPYGNKELHFGHIGGVFVQADTYARFLRDRIGKENVIFVSGTDGYGSPILEHYRQLIVKEDFKGTINEFVEKNHILQKEVLEAYNINLNLYAASNFGPAAEIHQEVSREFIEGLYNKGYLSKITSSQFYDPEAEVFLNGRQVVGQCPIQGCSSEKAYADECSLGHQYMPSELINPKSTISGKRPEMRDVANWYFKLEDFHDLLDEWVGIQEVLTSNRPFMTKAIREFLKEPVIYVKKDQLEDIRSIEEKLPSYTLQEDGNKASAVMVLKTLEDRAKVCHVLAARGIRFRTGKTLVPFRLTGNIEWGVPVPTIEDMENLTFWVWPESLWAPISFTRAYLKKQQHKEDEWKAWWASREARVYQFIGEDNIYFYGPAEMAMFMALNDDNPTVNPEEGQLQLPSLIANNHILFLDKKASSSGNVKPPSARELLNYYTAEQLRCHFLGLGLSMRSVGFQPKPLNPKANEKESDPVLKEGNLLSNVFNRVVRSCFYTIQQYYNGKIPLGLVDEEVLNDAARVIIEYEQLMHKYEFHSIMHHMDTYIRHMNKYWVKNMRLAEENNDSQVRYQTLINALHMVKVAAVLMHPIAPEGTEMIGEYLNLGEELWSWDNIFKTIYELMDNPADHCFKFLEPRVDFFKKHPSQLE